MTTISPRPRLGTTSPALIRWTSLSGPAKRMPIWASLARTQTGAERQQGVTIATVQNPTLRPAGADGSWRDQASVRLEGLVEMIGLCPDSLGFL